MPNIGGHRENGFVFEKLADRKFVVLCPLNLILQIGGGPELRQSLVPLFFVLLERNRAVPLLAANGQELFWVVREKSNIMQKEFVVRSSDGGIVGHRVESRLQPCSIRFQRKNGFLRRRLKFRGQALVPLCSVPSSAVLEHRRNLAFHPLQPKSNLLEISDCQRGKGANSMKVRLPIIDNPGNVLHPVHNRATAQSIKRRRLH